MRWTAEHATAWPPDAAWQRAWQAGVRDLLSTTVDASGLVSPTDPGAPSRPDLHLVSGTHLQPGAKYRLAPHVTTGVLRAWVAEGRAAGVEWAPHDEPGRAHLEVQTLDRLSGVRVESGLEELSGHLRFAVDPEHLLDVEVQLPWLKAGLRARVVDGRLRADVEVRGIGIWWPTLEPLFLAGSARIQQGLDEIVHDLAEALTSLPTADTSGGAFLPPRRPSAAEREASARGAIESGMAEIGRRQHAAAEAVRLLPWWRRTPTAWRQALDEQPAASWPSPEALLGKEWPAVEEIVTRSVVGHARWRRESFIDAEVADVGAAQLSGWQLVDRAVDDAIAAPAPGVPSPWLTDAETDLSWLATPWSTARHLMGAATDDEARARTEALVAGSAPEDVS